MLPAAEVATSEAPFSLFVETYWGHGPAVWIAAFAAVSALGALNGWTLIQAEHPARLAEPGLLPAWFARQNRHGAHAAGFLLSSVLAIGNASCRERVCLKLLIAVVTGSTNKKKRKHYIE